jgi:xylan 1,4-beta-xylosidase
MCYRSGLVIVLLLPAVSADAANHIATSSRGVSRGVTRPAPIDVGSNIDLRRRHGPRREALPFAVHADYRGSMRPGSGAGVRAGNLMPAAALLVLVGSACARLAPTRVVADVEVDAARSLGPLPRPWRYFGADEPNYATTEHGKKLLAQIGELAPGEMYFRAHNLLTSGDGTPALKWGSTNAYTERGGEPVYDFQIVDAILAAGLERGVKPLVEIGFMPEALSTSVGNYRHSWPKELFTGWTYPPKDYERWGELVYRWAQHCVDVYGAAEVQSWWWQTWNEPNIGYWSGTPDEFFRLNDHALAAVRRALPTARVGGPHTAGDGGEFMESFLEHALHGQNYATGERGTPLDYISFHAKGKPETVDGHIRMGMSNQLRTIDTAFSRFARYPELRNVPVIIGESDPEGCAACTGKEYDYRNGLMYASYTAAVLPRELELAARHGVQLEGAVTWAFTFVDQPLFAGFRQVASAGLPLAVFNVFRMLSKLGPERVRAASNAAVPLAEVLERGIRGAPDVGVLASRDAERLGVLVWHYHDDDVPGPDASVRLAIDGLPVATRQARLTHYRVDSTHGNVYAAWQRLGSPPSPSPEQYAELEAASALAVLDDGPSFVALHAGRGDLELELPRHAVSLLLIDLAE